MVLTSARSEEVRVGSHETPRFPALAVRVCHCISGAFSGELLGEHL